MIENRRFTNKNLNQLLAELGFKENAKLPDKFKRVWKHPDAGTTIVLPANRTLERPLQVDLIAVRNQLHFNGHMNGDDFDAFVRSKRQAVQN